MHKKCFILLSFFAKLQTFGQLQRIAAATAAATVVTVMTTMVGGGGICGKALIASLIAFIIPIDVLCIEYNFVAAAITRNGGQERKNNRNESVTQYSLSILTLSRFVSFIQIFSLCSHSQTFHKSGMQHAGRANRNRHTESSWHFNYISFYRFRMRCAFRLNTKHTHTHTCTLWKERHFQIKQPFYYLPSWNGMEWNVEICWPELYDLNPIMKYIFLSFEWG